MLTKAQLELLEDILEVYPDPLSPFTKEQMSELRAALASELWNITNQLSTADKRRIAKAEAEGKVAVYTRPAGWTLASRIEDGRANRPGPAIQATSGDELLAKLGLDL